MSEEEARQRLDELGLKDYEIVGDATNQVDCGGYVFLREQRGLIFERLYSLRERLGFGEIDRSASQPEDLVCYEGGKSPHVGFVKRIDPDGQIWVESKPGPLPAIIHKIDEFKELYGDVTVYHTSRPNGRFLSPVEDD